MYTIMFVCIHTKNVWKDIHENYSNSHLWMAVLWIQKLKKDSCVMHIFE